MLPDKLHEVVALRDFERIEAAALCAEKADSLARKPPEKPVNPEKEAKAEKFDQADAMQELHRLTRENVAMVPSPQHFAGNDGRGRGRGRGRGQGRGQGRGGSGNVSTRPGHLLNEELQCYKCLGLGHYSRDCPSLECYRCAGRGHFSSKCPSQWVTNNPGPSSEPTPGASVADDSTAPGQKSSN